MNENENITFRNLWVTARAVPRGKLIATKAYSKNERCDINNLTSQLKELGKKIKFKASRRK